MVDPVTAQPAPRRRQDLKDRLDRWGLLGAAYALRQAGRSARPHVVRGNLATRRQRTSDVPVPPLRLVYAVGGHFDRAAFVRMGADNFEDVLQAFRRGGGDPTTTGFRVLDFGCGCGRVLRYWKDQPGSPAGVDPNPRVVRWCQENLTFADVRRSDPLPPLPHADGSFDGIYAISVFTHLTVDAQRAWATELSRVLAPGGVLVVTTHGPEAARRLADPLRRDLDQHGVLVLHEGHEGSNLCAAYHTTSYMEHDFAPDLELVACDSGALRWSTHDVSVFRKSPGRS